MLPRRPRRRDAAESGGVCEGARKGKKGSSEKCCVCFLGGCGGGVEGGVRMCVCWGGGIFRRVSALVVVRERRWLDGWMVGCCEAGRGES